MMASPRTSPPFDTPRQRILLKRDDRRADMLGDSYVLVTNDGLQLESSAATKGEKF